MIFSDIYRAPNQARDHRPIAGDKKHKRFHLIPRRFPRQLLSLNSNASIRHMGPPKTPYKKDPLSAIYVWARNPFWVSNVLTGDF